MTSHILLLAVLALPNGSHANAVRSTSNSEGFTKLNVGDMTIEGQNVRFRSDGKTRTCSIEGSAKVKFGDITTTAEKIQIYGNGEDRLRLICNGQCTWQDDNSGESLSGDKLEFDGSGLKLSGHASLRYSTGHQMTVATCESLTFSFEDGYQLSGAVRLQHGESRTKAK